MPRRTTTPVLPPVATEANAGTHLVRAYGPGGAPLFKALASEVRLAILELLAAAPHNINEISLALGAAQPAVSKHVQILERAGLVASATLPGAQGLQKRCRLVHDRLLVSLEGPPGVPTAVEEASMPVGLFTRAEVRGTCGMASRDGLIAWLDDPRSFFVPERAKADLLWTAGGFVEYAFPNLLPRPRDFDRLELVMEICSEAPDYDAGWPSDITVWINGVEIGTWTSPGDFGGRRGRLNPAWWMDRHTQHGVLKIFTVDREGASIDGNSASLPGVAPVTIADLGLEAHRPIAVRIGVKPDARYQGGFNLFGRGFGNYPQDLVLRLHHKAPGTVAPSRSAFQALPLNQSCREVSSPPS